MEDIVPGQTQNVASNLGLPCLPLSQQFLDTLSILLWQGVNSLAQWLEHWSFTRADPVRIPQMNFFQLCIIPLLRLSCHKMEAHLKSDYFTKNGFCVIINDNFLEEGVYYGLSLLSSIICLGRFRIACRYIFNPWQLRQRIDSGSVVRALDFYLGRPGLNPMIGVKFFQLCFILLLRLSWRKK